MIWVVQNRSFVFQFTRIHMDNFTKRKKTLNCGSLETIDWTIHATPLPWPTARESVNLPSLVLLHFVSNGRRREHVGK